MLQLRLGCWKLRRSKARRVQGKSLGFGLRALAHHGQNPIIHRFIGQGKFLNPPACQYPEAQDDLGDCQIRKTFKTLTIKPLTPHSTLIKALKNLNHKP